jgi:plastocyanin
MRRVLFVVWVLPLLALGATTGPTGVTAVAVTAAGFSPATASIRAGDTVTWTNLDKSGAAHQVVFDGGGAASPVLQAGQSWSRHFPSKGSFPYHDGRRAASKATIAVAPALPTVTAQSSVASVGFGGRATLSGRVSSGRAGQVVTVYARPCGQLSLVKLAAVKTKAGGAYRLVVKPRRTTAYGVRWRKVSSAGVVLPVRPLLRLRAASGAFALRVYAASSFAGKVAQLQRFDEAEGDWKLAGQMKLAAGGTPSTGTFLSVGTGKAAGTGRVRALLPVAAAAPCYTTATSNELPG